MSSLGEKVRALRKSRDMTMEDLAAKIELTRGSVSHIERDFAKPSLDALKRIGEVFCVSPGLLLDDSVSPEKLAEISLVLEKASKLSEKNLRLLLSLAESLQDA